MATVLFLHLLLIQEYEEKYFIKKKQPRVCEKIQKKSRKFRENVTLQEN